jgi:DNA-binding response OmpR family regulator
VHERDAAEIRARVRALLRRSATGAARRRFDARIDCGPLRLHPATHRVSFEDRSEQLTATEYQLLSHLALSPERTFSRDELLRTVWGYGHAGYSHTLTTHVNRLREKLERRLGAPRVIETVRGRGYRFADPAERS